MELLIEFREVLAVTAGALLGYLASFILWRKAEKERRREERIDAMRQMLALNLRAGGHARAILYAKTEGVAALSNIGSDPLDELMAYAMTTVPQIGPSVQEMHFRMQEIHRVDIHSIGDPGEYAINKMDEFTNLMAKIQKKLSAVAEEEGLCPQIPKEIEEEHRQVIKRFTA